MIWAMAVLVIILMALIAWGDIKLMLGFLALVLVAGITLLFYDNWADKHASKLIAVEQVALQEFSIRPLAGGVHELTGRVLNNAGEHRLRQLEIGIRALDCNDAEPAECVTIGEVMPWIHAEIPAGQARDIKEKVLFNEGRPQAKGSLRWDFEVISTQAD